MCKPNKYFSANQQKLLRKPIQLQLSVEPDQSSIFYQLSMINQHSVYCKCWSIHIMADLCLRFELRVEVGEYVTQTCIYCKR